MNIEEEILTHYTNYDYNNYSSIDVLNALRKPSITIEDYEALLSPCAMNYLEEMAQKAQLLTRQHFGNQVCLFTPIYISNYCVNHCSYCGFNCTNKIHRAKLSLDEIKVEYEEIAKSGLKEILILTGESRHASDITYIGEAVELAKNYFSTIGIEVYPMEEEEYHYLQKKGADYVSVYQETYNRTTYDTVHISGPKKVFSYRLEAQERALKAGMRGVGVGALLGLDDFRKDAYAAGLHAYYLQKKYPHAELSFSVPRLRPFVNHSENNSNDVHEKQLLQVMLAYRILLPFAGITISTRERPSFRDNVVGLIATKISAGVKTGIGGHKTEEKGDAQFEIADPRTVDQIIHMLQSRKLQCVYTDYIRV